MACGTLTVSINGNYERTLDVIYSAMSHRDNLLKSEEQPLSLPLALQALTASTSERPSILSCRHDKWNVMETQTLIFGYNQDQSNSTFHK